MFYRRRQRIAIFSVNPMERRKGDPSLFSNLQAFSADLRLVLIISLLYHLVSS